MTLDVNFYSFDQPKEYVFFKSLGLSISSFTPEVSVQGRICDDTLLYLNIAMISGRKQLIVETECEAVLSPGISGFMYCKPHDVDELAMIKKKMDSNIDYRIYYLAHSFLDLKSEFEKLEVVHIDTTRITFLVSNYGQNSQLHSKKSIQNILRQSTYNEFIVVNPYKKEKQDTQHKNSNKTGVLFFLLMKLVRVLLAPGYFIKRLVEQLRVHKFVWFVRSAELIAFVWYAVSKIFGAGVDTYNFAFRNIKVGGIRLLYLLRHLLLMSGFKSFGIFVDTYQILRTALIKSSFFVRHIVVMGYFKTYGFFVDLYYWTESKIKKVYVLLRHVALMSYFKGYGLIIDGYYIIRLIFIRSYYIIRHVFLMSYFKLYGVTVDSANLTKFLSIRFFWFVRNKALFPVYKIYWFLSYQYKKRIKKEIR